MTDRARKAPRLIGVALARAMHGALLALGEFLADTHGQHEHQWLVQRDYQRRLLDAFAGAEADAAEVAARHGGWRRAAEALAARERAQASSEREREFLREEIRDLEALAFTPEGWAGEAAEHRRLAHAQELIAHCRAALEAADEAEPSATGLIAGAAARPAQAAEVDPELAQAHRDLETAAAHAAEAAHQLRRYLQRVEPDPQRLDALERRLRAVHDAARRLRTDPAGLPDALAARRERLAELGGEESVEALRARETEAKAAFGEAARALSAKRREAARRLGEEVTRQLQGLAMEGGRLEVVLEPLAEPSAGGLEAVELRVAAHAGQPVGPVGKVPSGSGSWRAPLGVIAERNCTVPKDKALFYPLGNSFWVDCPNSPDEDLTDDEVRAIMATYGGGGDNACQPTSTLDGVAISSEHIPTIRSQSPTFSATLPEGHVLVGSCYFPPDYPTDLPPGKTGRMISEGYWVMLPPLSRGEHTLTLHGAGCDPTTGAVEFEVGVTYHLTVN